VSAQLQCSRSSSSGEEGGAIRSQDRIRGKEGAILNTTSASPRRIFPREGRKEGVKGQKDHRFGKTSLLYHKEEYGNRRKSRELGVPPRAQEVSPFRDPFLSPFSKQEDGCWEEGSPLGNFKRNGAPRSGC